MKLSRTKFLLLTSLLYFSFFTNGEEIGYKIYQSDSLYPYEYCRSILQNGFIHSVSSWYYPPSNYIFPDIIITFPLVFLEIPPSFSLHIYLLMSVVLFVYCLAKWSSQKINSLFFLALLVSYSLDWKKAILPLFLPAHHGTGFLLYLYFYQAFREDKYQYFVFRSLLILSDPFLIFACFLPEVLIHFKRLRIHDGIMLIVSLIAIALSSGRAHPSIFTIPVGLGVLEFFSLIMAKIGIYIYQLHIQSWNKLWVSIPIVSILWLFMEWKNKKLGFSISLFFIFIFSIVAGGIFLPNFYPIRYFSGILIIGFISFIPSKFFQSRLLIWIVMILVLMQFRTIDHKRILIESNEYSDLKSCLMDQNSIDFIYDFIGTDYWTARPLRLIMNEKIVDTYGVGKELFWIRPQEDSIDWDRDQILYLYRSGSDEYKQSLGELKRLKTCGNYDLLRRP